MNRSAEDYNLDLLQNGSARAVKRAVVKRTSEILFIDKWYGPIRNNGRIREYGIEARGLVCRRPILTLVNASIRDIR